MALRYSVRGRLIQEDFDTLVPATSGSNRRAFGRGAIGTGLAAAVLPVAAQTIKTDSQGLIDGEVTLRVAGLNMPAYRAAPDCRCC